MAALVLARAGDAGRAQTMADDLAKHASLVILTDLESEVLPYELAGIGKFHSRRQ